MASRLGPAQARVAAVLLLTLPGTPILYQGDELGLADVPIPPAQALDPIASLVPGRGRDPERTPMPWDAGPGGGFTSGRPWLPLGAGNLALSVAAQRDDPCSILALHRRQVRLRRNAPALVGGGYQPVESDGDVLAYQRAALGGASYLVALNLGPTRPARPFPARRWPAGSWCRHPRTARGRRSAATWSCAATRAWCCHSLATWMPSRRQIGTLDNRMLLFGVTKVGD